MTANITRMDDHSRPGIEHIYGKVSITTTRLATTEGPDASTSDPSRPAPFPITAEQEVAAVHPATASQPAPNPPAARQPLTGRQEAMLGAIRGYVRDNGYPPSMRELGQRTGLSSLSSVSFVLDQLHRKGYVRRDPGRPRAIVILPPADAAER